MAVEQLASSPRGHTVSSLEHPTADGLPAALIDPNGPPRRPPPSIPAIDEPKFARASTATYLENDEPVPAIEVDGEARAIQPDIGRDVARPASLRRPSTGATSPSSSARTGPRHRDRQHLGRAGNATDGRWPLRTTVEHVDTFWFAWAAFLPETRIAKI